MPLRVTPLFSYIFIEKVKSENSFICGLLKMLKLQQVVVLAIKVIQGVAIKISICKCQVQYFIYIYIYIYIYIKYYFIYEQIYDLCKYKSGGIRFLKKLFLMDE